MIAAPPEGSRTLCELQCRLVSAPAGSAALPGPACPDADLSAPPAAGQPAAYAAVVKCPSGQWPAAYHAEDGSWDSSAGASSSGLRPLLQQLVGRLPRGAAALLERLLGLAACPAPGTPLAWHPSQPLLAAVGAAGQVQVVDYTGQLPVLGQQGSGAPPPPPLAPALTLQHELQQGAAAAAWRPHGGKGLAVGTAQGVCLWHIGRPPAGSGSRSDGGAWMVWLKAPGGGPVTTLSWHPQGHLLAGASPGSPGFFVWDVATGSATPISAGPEPACLLRWSPCGGYLLAAQPGGAFRIWETQTWWSQSWAAGEGGASASGGRLVEAAWGPDCRSLLLAYEGSPQLVSLNFTGEPPSLQAQLLPLPLAELNASGASKGASAGLVQAVAWDARAQRLAIALGGSHPAAGCVALYDTRCDPILSARFIGFLRLGPLGGGDGSSGGAAGGSRLSEPEWEEIRPEEVAEAAGAVGASVAAVQRHAPVGSGASTATATATASSQAPLALAFLPGFGQGTVLAARCGDHRVATVPLYFAV